MPDNYLRMATLRTEAYRGNKYAMDRLAIMRTERLAMRYDHGCAGPSECSVCWKALLKEAGYQ